MASIVWDRKAKCVVAGPFATVGEANAAVIRVQRKDGNKLDMRTLDVVTVNIQN